jgi:hypothetical protein
VEQRNLKRDRFLETLTASAELPKPQRCPNSDPSHTTLLSLPPQPTSHTGYLPEKLEYRTHPAGGRMAALSKAPKPPSEPSTLLMYGINLQPRAFSPIVCCKSNNSSRTSTFRFFNLQSMPRRSCQNVSHSQQHCHSFVQPPDT